MSKTINRVELLGRVGTEPEMRYAPSGTAVTQLRLATDRRRQDGTVEADWHTVTCWGKLAEAVSQYVHKGDRLYVAGRLAQNSYETQDGQRRHSTEIHAAEGRLPRLPQRGQRQGRRGRGRPRWAGRGGVALLACTDRMPASATAGAPRGRSHRTGAAPLPF